MNDMFCYSNGSKSLALFLCTSNVYKKHHYLSSSVFKSHVILLLLLKQDQDDQDNYSDRDDHATVSMGV